MEKWITSLAFLLAFHCVQAQIEVAVKKEQLTINDTATNKNSIVIVSTEGGENYEIKISDYPNLEQDKELKYKGINYKIISEKQKIVFWKEGENEKDHGQDIYFCPSKTQFSKELSKCGATNTLQAPNYAMVHQIPFPSFQEPDDTKLLANKSNRYLIIDASANHNKKINNSLFKEKDVASFGETNQTTKVTTKTDALPINEKTEEFDKNFTKADALPVNASVTIFIRNYNFHDLEKISVAMTGADFSYSYSIKDILAQLKDKVAETEEKGAEATSNKGKEKLNNDLSNILTKFKSYTYLNLNDLYKIEEYKRQLYQYYEKNYATFGEEEVAIFSEILHWYPTYLSITPIAITVPENDEVAINVTLKNKNDDTPYQNKVGQFKTTGGIGFNLGGMFYITNLKNNSVYTKASETTGKVRAFMNGDNQSSVGIGLNSEIYFRTGYLVRPTLNMGFFLPFDEDLTPFGAIGPGISIASKKVKFSLSWGLAVGKINAIKEQYKDVEIDPTDLTNDQLGEKVWRFGNYFGFGLTYNL